MSLSSARAPFRLAGWRAYALAAAVTGAAGLFTGLSWPFFSLAPFAPTFLAVYIAARWGTRGASTLAILAGCVWSLWLSPAEAVQFSPIPTGIFATIAFIAAHFVVQRSEALEARQASEARAIQALNETTAAEAKLRQAQKMEAVGQLVAGVAHNFNNLLTITMGYADLLHDSVSEAGRPHLREIQHATARGAELTRQLLAITRKQDAALTLVDLNGALHQLEALLTPLIREDITLAIERADGPAVVLIDPQDFAQVILNLVVNARDAMPEGGRITITIAPASVAETDIPATFMAHAGDFVCVTVRDSGVGMTPDVLARLFEPFFTTKEVDQGTGLGLAFTYGVVRGARGFITVASTPGAGTTVALYLPVAQGRPANLSMPAPASAARPPAVATILVVEDEAPVRMVAVRTLAGAGYAVFEAESPADAIAVFEREPAISLLLTDVVMPGMRGPDLARTLQARRPDLRVILMSGYHEGGTTDTRSFLYMDKPFTRTALLDAVQTALRA